ncbi:MAG: GTPase, partial [Anaerolineae bacterium]
MAEKRMPVVALVGRPNVGKSTLFNRLQGARRAIVEGTPGTTRDRLYGESEWAGVSFLVVDTGGLELREGRDAGQGMPLSVGSADYVEAIRNQAQVAMDEADVIVFLVDAQEGLTAADRDVADLLRRAQKPVVLAANKCDNEALRQQAMEFYALGMGRVFPISALHGTGTGDL